MNDTVNSDDLAPTTEETTLEQEDCLTVEVLSCVRASAISNPVCIHRSNL
jgi:hypothetical protein